MADAQAVSRSNEKGEEITLFSIMAGLAGWLVPGAGHLIQKRWVRGFLLMLSVFSMFALGLMMSGKVYGAGPKDLLDALGLIGDIGSGALYFLAVIGQWGNPAVQIAAADYGTKFIIVAGLMNIVSAVDAHNIALGKKN
jgi:hypothetical protein